MSFLSEFLSSAGTNDHFDWKDDEKENSKPKEGRTKIPFSSLNMNHIPKKVDSSQHRQNQKDKNLPLTTLQQTTLQAVSKRQNTIQRPKRFTKKNFKRDNLGIQYITDRNAALYFLYRKQNESYSEFNKRMPSKVRVKISGKDYTASIRVGEERKTFSTRGLDSISIKSVNGKDVIQVHKAPRSLLKHEFQIPKGIYAAWKVDGEQRGISLRDYYTLKKPDIQKYSSDGDFVFHHSGEKDESNEFRFKDHAAFYLDSDDQLKQLSNSYFTSSQIDSSLDKLEARGFIISASHKSVEENLRPTDYRLTEKGQLELDKIRSQLEKKAEGKNRGQGLPEQPLEAEKTRANEKERELKTPHLLQEMEDLKIVGRAVGFIPEFITTSETREALDNHWRRFYHRETLTTRTGIDINAWVPKNKANTPNFKKQELGHELILAAGIHDLSIKLRNKGATEIRFIPEAELRSMQTRHHQGYRVPSILDQGDPSVHPVKGIPDGVFIYKTKEGQNEALAVEADAGGSPYSNSKGYREEMLQSKDAWAQARNMAIVYVAHTSRRANKISMGHRHTLFLQK